MICPYCNKEMEKGFIPANKSCVSWLPDGSRKSFVVYNPSKYNGIKLTNNPIYKSEEVIAYNCTHCKKVIIDYSIL